MPQPVDRQANAALFARLEDLRAGYSRLRSDLDSLREGLADVKATATSPDGLVSVDVGPRGNLLAVTIKDRAYSAYSAELLGRAVTLLARRAEQQAAQQARELLTGYVPEGLAPPGLSLDQALRRQDERMERLREG